MGQNFLIDTNVIIERLDNKLLVNAINLLNNINLTVSAVTKIEVLGWHKVEPQQLSPLLRFMEAFIILPIDDFVIDQAIAIRQAKKIALGDSIIAATALVYDFTLLTRNENDFTGIERLHVVNPHKL